jgi:hypothetical protein
MFLRQSTTQVVQFGPALDEDDGKTSEAGLTIAQADMQLSKDGGTFAQKSAAGNATHDADGWYYTTLSTTDTATVGELVLQVHVSGALPMQRTYWVIEEAIYDMLYGASALGYIANAPVNVAQISGDGPAADNLEADYDGAGYNKSASTIGTATALGASATSAQLVDDVWDELITGAAHTTTNSAGKRLRDLAESGTYSGGAVFIDTVNGSAGTDSYINGTEVNPVNTIADANTIAGNVGLSKFVIAPGSSITFAASQQNQVFTGHGWTLALGSQSIVGSTFIGATVTGVATGTGDHQDFIDCHMGAVTHIKDTTLKQCAIEGTQTVGEAGEYFLDRCYSAIAGASTWVFEFGDAIGNTNLNVRNYSGGIQLESMGDTGTDTASIEGQGQVIEGTCTGGTVAVRGAFTVSGITNLTLSDDARLDMPQINAEVTDVTITTGISDSATAADRLETSVLTVVAGQAQTGTLSTTQMTTNLSEATDDHYNGRTLIWTSGNLLNQATNITDYAGSGGLLTFPAVTDIPADGDNFIIV